MPKSRSYSKSSKSGDRGDYWKTFNTPKAPAELKDRNLLGTNPLKEQFEPLDSMPIRQKHRMAGAG